MRGVVIEKLAWGGRWSITEGWRLTCGVTGTLFRASTFLSEELPIRLAHRVEELGSLPDGLGEMTSIRRVQEWYAQSFEVHTPISPDVYVRLASIGYVLTHMGRKSRNSKDLSSPATPENACYGHQRTAREGCHRRRITRAWCVASTARSRETGMGVAKLRVQRGDTMRASTTGRNGRRRLATTIGGSRTRCRGSRGGTTAS